MWLPLRLVLEYLARSAAWLAVLGAVGILAALAVVLALRRPLRSAWPGTVAAAIVGGLLGASLAHRLALPEAYTFAVWCRPVPLAWSAGGALAGAAAAAAWQKRRRRAPAPGETP